MTEASGRIRQVFAMRNARLLLAVRIFGQAGDGLLQTALATFILFSPERQNNPTRIALAFAILLVPYSVVGPFVGVFIDRWSRQRILQFSNIARGTAMLAICAVVLNHGQNLLLALLVLITLGINRFVQACLAASVPHVVSQENLVTANALFPTLGTSSAALAAALGVASQKIWTSSDRLSAIMILIGCCSTLIASFIATRIQPHGVLGPEDIEAAFRHNLLASLRGLLAGLKALNQCVDARNSMFAAALQRFAFGITTIFALVLSRTSWSRTTQVGNSISDFGACAGSAAFGGFVAAMISVFLLSEADHTGHRVVHQAHLRFASILASVFSLPIIIWAMQNASLIAVCIAAFTIAFTGAFLKINADTTVQTTVEDDHRGRVFSIFDMLLNASFVIGISLFALTPTIANNALITSLITAAALLTSAYLIWDKRERSAT